MSGSAGVKSNLSHDEVLARLLGELTEQLRTGQRPDIEAIARQYPKLADELRELWAAAQIAEQFANHGSRSRTTAAHAPGASAAAAGVALPRPFGDYELLEELGRGGMGVVYKARQRNPERTVAIKMILRGELASKADLARFRAEAQSAARLEGHPSVVAVHEVGEVDGQPFFSMKYVEGTTLAKLVAQGPLSSREAARHVSTVCQAVHYAHQHGILHRDLKPSNVLIDGQGQAHVADFGLAKRVEGGASLTQTGAILGTPSYMPPEQASNSRGVLGPASDVYSLGAVLYESLTGRPPFKAATPMDTLMQVLEQDVVPPRLLNANVDRDLEMICLKCLQKPIDLRYATAKELQDDLDAFLQGEPIAARPLSVAHFLGRMLGETHHAAVLENWGVLWMWHSLVLIVLCSLTNVLALQGVKSVFPYLGIWGIGLGAWASIFWALRRRAGPVTFVERQIAHVWLASTLGSISLFGVEVLLGLEVLTLSPVLAILAGMVFLVKAGMLSGSFYLAAAASFATAAFMALVPSLGLFAFGLVSAACFFIPGFKYYRQRQRSPRLAGKLG
jgi:serine/threonine protein kinase